MTLKAFLSAPTPKAPSLPALYRSKKNPETVLLVTSDGHRLRPTSFPQAPRTHGSAEPLHTGLVATILSGQDIGAVITDFNFSDSVEPYVGDVTIESE